jgi:hypothetical protein
LSLSFFEKLKGTVNLPGTDGETTTTGLDGMAQRW